MEELRAFMSTHRRSIANLAVCLAFAAGVLDAGLSSAADEPARAAATAKRPRICLVLSGGGARGAAHIGVLKVLEELRVPIDCIAGTSMGSVIGASYASGTTTADMELAARGLSTDLLFKEKPPRQEQSIRRKQDDYTILFGPEIGIRGTDLLLPKGIVSGVQLESVLRQLAKAKGYRKFDELPIPYRAVATDLVTGKPVVFSEGELANIMRASMSVPGAIAPAETGGMILVDGGLTNNLPVNVARAMGADIVIAVNLGTPLLKRDQLSSILGVTGQMINILTEQNVQASLASLKPTDILIEPELGDYSAADFDNLPKTVPIGEAAARKVSARLTPLALPPAEYAALRQRQLAFVPSDLRPVDEIRFENLTHVNPRTATSLMDTKPNQPIDQQVLDRDLRRLYGTGDFEHVNYRLVEEPGKRVLAIDAVENPSPDYLRFGLGLAADFQGDAFFNILASHRKRWLNPLGAEWRNDLQVGRANRFRSEFYQPLDERQYFFVAPRFEFDRYPVYLYQGNKRLAQYDLQSTRAQFDVGSQFTRYGELRAGVMAGSLKASLDTGLGVFAPRTGSVSQGAYIGRLFVDQLDSATFPRTGYQASANITGSRGALGADDPYTKWRVDATRVFSAGDHTFNFALKAGDKIGGSPLPAYDQFNSGGFLQQSGFRTGALAGQSLAFGRAMYYHKLARQDLLEGLYGGVSLEAGRIGSPLVPGSPTGLQKSGSLFFGMDTYVGPLYFGYGYAAGGFRSFYLYLGRI